MKKNFLAMTALAAMLFAGCTSSDELTTLESIKQAENAPTPISFGTYMGKTGTRAGYVGPITQIELQDGKSGSNTKGFGVFAHYASDGTAYNNLTSRIPNFMYNEQVYYDASTWKYDNIKYWPNGTNTSTSAADNANATSTSDNKVSFFAYAPYVSESTTWGSETYGIINMSGSSAVDNPKITYKLDNTNFVDLLWGTAGTNGTDIAGNTQSGSVVSTKADGSTTTTDAGYANIAVNADMKKQKVGGVIQFAFKHALAQVGGYSTTAGVGLTVKADVDDDPNVSGGTLDNGNTKITSVS